MDQLDKAVRDGRIWRRQTRLGHRINTLPDPPLVREFPADSPQNDALRIRNSLCRRVSPMIYLALFVLAMQLGCEQPVVQTNESNTDIPQKAAESAEAEAPEANDYSALPQGASLLASSETWHTNYLQGKKIGYRHTVVREFELGSQHYTQTDILERQSLLRFGEKVSLEVKARQLVNDKGEITQIGYELPLGEEITRVQGKVTDGTLVYWKEGQQEQAPEQVVLPKGTLGFSGLEDSLAKAPMKSGEERDVIMLQLPPLPIVGTVHLAAKETEPTLLQAGEVQLLRVDEKIVLPGGGSILCHFWPDSTGRILKYSVPAVQQETYLVSREQALDDRESFSVDLGSDMLVRLTKPLVNPHQRSKASYRVHLAGELPPGTIEKLLSSGLSQEVDLIDDHTTLVTVIAVRPGQPKKLTSEQPKPTKQDSQPSSLVESDAAEIVALAHQATDEKLRTDPSNPASEKTGKENESWQQALAMEKFVHDYLTEKNYSQAFSSAAEVARTREGDCTEHAVLVAALCRAKGIPARVAYGLVYVSGENAFAFHMWNEVWMGDRWVPMDATLALGGIGAGHIKFGHSSLSDFSALLELLPVMQTIGKLEISESTDSQE